MVITKARKPAYGNGLIIERTEVRNIGPMNTYNMQYQYCTFGQGQIFSEVDVDEERNHKESEYGEARLPEPDHIGLWIDKDDHSLS